MIAELSAGQTARIPEFVEKWTKIGLSTDPANRPAAEEGVRLAYRSAGLEPPSKIVWCESPLAMALAHSVVRKTTAPAVREAIMDLSTSDRDLISDSFVTPFAASARSLIWVPVFFSVWGLIWNAVRDSVEDLVEGSFGVAIWGQQYAGWNAFNDYLRVVCGLTEQTKVFLGVMQVGEHAGSWLPCEDICWCSERPNRLICDDQGRLHCDDGPSIAYPDGFSIYAIHGVLVNEQIIMRPRSQNVDTIRTEFNIEIKRIRIERFGWGEYLRAVGAVVVDTRDNHIESTKEALMRTPDDQVVLVCACPSTSRVYSLEVPPDILTCEGAQDWLSGGLSNRVINGA